MNLPQDGIKLHRGNFTAIGQQIQPYLEDGKCFRMVLKPWRERRSLSQNALSHMWYSEISEYLISKGKTFATPVWVPNTEELRQNPDRSRSMKSEITIN
ncbi:DNA-binding protein [Escherichia coli]